MRKTAGIIGVALVAFAGTANAQNFGDIIFTDQNTDTIYSASGFGPSVPTALFSRGVPADESRLADIVFVGDSLYVADGGQPAGTLPIPSPSLIFRVDDLFGTPSATTIADNDRVQNPIGMTYDSARNRLTVVNNPSLSGGQQVSGLIGVDLAGPFPTNPTFMFEDVPLNDPRPHFEEGTYIINDPTGVGDFIAIGVNGGAYRGGAATLDRASTMYRFNVDNPGDFGTTDELMIDFSASFIAPEFGFDPDVNLTNVRGITNIGNDLYVTNLSARDDANTPLDYDGIYRVALDPNTGAPLSLDLVFDLGLMSPEVIEYNPFTGKLVFADVDFDDNGNIGILAQINPDGTGFEILASGVHVRGLEFVPAPSTLALLGLGGLAAARRRRA